ncbi:MAG TPA: helix-turn-helix transcriptional regulator [Chitinophagales bacterium]|nr:helix-turn-helix transcriptional regulator [Chitinophagales bacterium]
MTELECIKTLGQNIKKIRLEKRMNQVDLALACDFKKPNMQRIEAGNTNPTFKTLLRIARALEVNVSDLLMFEAS